MKKLQSLSLACYRPETEPRVKKAAVPQATSPTLAQVIYLAGNGGTAVYFKMA
jgi:hypothetical protein